MTPRSNPFDEIERLFENMSRQFEEASWSWGDREPFARFSTAFETMAIDVVEHDDEFVVTVDLPGFERDEVDVRVTDHRLTIEAEHESEMEEGDETYLRQERSHREMKRTITLPDAVDEGAVTARMKNGVLTVTCPKVEVEEAHEIEIE
jgi:HSP20 family protein